MCDRPAYEALHGDHAQGACRTGETARASNCKRTTVPLPALGVVLLRLNGFRANRAMLHLHTDMLHGVLALLDGEKWVFVDFTDGRGILTTREDSTLS